MRYLIIVAAAALFARDVNAQGASPRKDSVQTLRAVTITAEVEDRSAIKPIQQLTLPVTVSISQRRAEETVNLVDAEDAVKYLPSVFLRKRNNGDTQATLATRVWGTSSSARTLIFADGVPLTALIANNNTVGGPRWGLVAPPEVERIDMMMGPYSAAYAGNSMGAVMEITTRLPQKLEGQIQQTQAVQSFDLYGTRRNFMTSQTGASVGDRWGKLAIWASGNYQKSNSQPLSYVTSASIPAGTTGTYPDSNRLNAPANVLGASGLLNTHMTNGKIKAAYDITPTLRASYTFGLWRNDGNSGVQAYTTNAGQPTFAGQAGFASGFYDLDQRHTAQALTLRTDRKKDWDLELVGSMYRFNYDQQRSPVSVATSGASFNPNGRVAVLDGTGWATLDLKGTWKPFGQISAHTLSSGVHYEHYSLENTTYNTSSWTDGGSRTGVFTEGDGKTETKALWAQDAWYITPELKLTVGGRYEDWRGYDGLNVNGTTRVVQPTVEGQKFSPKGQLTWNASERWTFSAAMAKAYRFATAAELYQLVSTGTTFSSPDPNLKPDNVTSTELRVQRKFERASVQLSLFQDDVHDAIISQFNTLNGSTQLYSFISNVDHVRARGAELGFGTNDVLLKGLAFSGNVTAVDPKTLAMSGRASATAAPDAAIGKQLPNIPKWRATASAMYRPNERTTFTLAGRYSSKLYTTLDNADVRYNTYQGFSEWFVMDTKANYRVNDNWSASLGVDNLLDRKYFLFHPFPHRTFVAGLKYGFE
ncbi:MAG: TonB-dependent receptor [Gemmatimonadetes bacterium]|nr:MAG: TonB-dependent receptor [Gemmatimonadota bacterium]